MTGTAKRPRAARMAIDVQLAHPPWRRAVPDAIAWTRRCARAAWRTRAARGPADMAIVLGDDDFLRDLNHTYRGKNRPTNVLAFAADELSAPHESHVGDIAIAYGVAAREARLARRPLNHHLAHLVVHGVLHLLGHDHERDDEARVMESIETAVLAQLGVPDPYRPAPRN